MMHNQRFSFACRCGAHWQGTVPMKYMEYLLRNFTREHSGEGHGRCSVREAGIARAKQERHDAAKGEEATPH